MKIHSNTHSALRAIGFQRTLTVCAGAALFAMSSTAFAQIDRNLKAGTVDKTYRVAPTDKGAHNPPADKCGHNPPDDKVARTGDTRMLLPAVKLAADGKASNAPQTDTTACPKAK
nr:hypothetical protein [Rhodoferax sp.]